MKKTQRQKELHKIEDDILRCRRCPLHKSRLNAVPGRGPCPAKLMLIGEAPSKEEDIQGHPFVGRSGVFLDKLLKAVNLTRRQIYITSSVKCRPPENRIPHTDELSICKTAWLDRQISFIRPKIIVLLGKIAVKQVLGISSNLGLMHGRFLKENNINCLVTFHPASAMRFPKIRRQALQDFTKLRQLLNAFHR